MRSQPYIHIVTNIEELESCSMIRHHWTNFLDLDMAVQWRKSLRNSLIITSNDRPVELSEDISLSRMLLTSETKIKTIYTCRSVYH